MKKNICSVILVLFLSILSMQAQITYIADTDFEQALIDLEIDSDGVINGEVLTEDINSITDLSIINKGISDLTGIEDFDNLEVLNCSSNQLDSLNLASNTLLLDLNCSFNDLSSLILPPNSNLEKLNCSGNLLLGNLDISTHNYLQELDFSSNQISELTTVNNDSLRILRGSNNNLITLEVDGSSFLKELEANNNEITELNISVYDSLAILKVSDNRLTLLNTDNNPNLEDLICSNNQIENLNLSNNTYLRNFIAGSNHLENINLIANDSLRILDVGYNELTNLSVSNNTILENLTCSGNQLTILNLSANDSLVTLGASNNQLRVLDVSNNLKLKSLVAASNQISALDLTANIYLESIDVSDNLITSLDLSLMNSVECQDPDDPEEVCQSEAASINVWGNRLTSLTISNGYNEHIAIFNAINNPDLYCIEVDDVATANITDGWLKDPHAFYGTDCIQVTYVPDDNFEQALIDLNLDDDLDNYVLTSNIETVTNLNVNNQNIIDLTGIEGFIALENLDVSNNAIDTLNVSYNSALTSLDFSNNSLSVPLDFSQNTALTILNGNNTGLNFLDLTNNIMISELNVASNSLLHLDLGNLVNLSVLNCNSNQLTKLNLRTNTNLTDLDCASNDLRVLNVDNGNNTNVTNFDATDNSLLSCIDVDDEAYSTANWTNIDPGTSFSEDCDLTFIPDLMFENYLETHDADGNVIPIGDASSLGDGINGNALVLTSMIILVESLDINDLGIVDLIGIEDFQSLDTLNCFNNLLVRLDLSNNTSLLSLNCSNNVLTQLNIKNGQNNNLSSFDSTTNPLLYCITVDDPDLANMAVGWLKDDQASYNLDCSSRQTFVPDNNFEQALIDQGLDYGSLDGFVPTANIENLLILDISEKGINDLTGIEDFINLTTLDCSGNFLTSLNINNNVGLNILDCGDNNLTNLDLSSNTGILELYCDSNNLSALDTTALTNLSLLDCSTNHISSADLIINSNITELICGQNDLTTIDLSGYSNLINFNCSDNYLTELDVSNNTALEFLICSDNFLSALDLTQNTSLKLLYCDSNELDILDFSFNADLEFINCENNNLTDINIEANHDLMFLNVASNELNNLNISQNDALKHLNCSNNDFGSTGINLDNNIDLTRLIAINNRLSSLNIQNNIQLDTLNISNNSIPSLDLTNHSVMLDLDISSNDISDLDLSSMNNLIRLNIGINQFTSLDLNALGNLTRLNCSSNALVSLKVANGNNSNLIEFNAMDNNDLECIEIDDENFIGEEWLADEGTSYSENCHYNDTYVPDDNFEQALAVYDDFSNDNYVPTANIEILTNLDVSAQNIADLTGIEDFIALEILDVSNNVIDSLNVSYNTALTTLSFSNNTLLSPLNLSQNTNLTSLIGNDAGLSDLDLANNSNISSLELAYNQFTEIDVSNLSGLVDFTINDNNIVDLDLSNNTSLVNLNCASNELFTLNIQNGNNDALLNLDATGNPDLLCVQADTDNVPTGVNWQIGGASLNTNCHYYQTYVPDDTFEAALISQGYDSGNLDDYVPTSAISGITVLNISQENISDLTGIEDFESLVNFNCSSNQIVEIDLSSNPYIENLNCADNLISNIDLTVMTNLEILNISNNNLTNIDVNSNTNLYYLNVRGNSLTFLDLTANVNLTTLDCSYNSLDLLLDLSQNDQLAYVYTNSNQLRSIDMRNGNNGNILHFDSTQNLDLSCILVEDLNADFSNWYIDPWSAFKLICDDTDNDGIPDNEDLCPNTPIGDPVDLFGCSYFSLPTDNFTIQITSENCISSNNGKVSISAIALYNYTATLIGDDYYNTFNFTNGVDILNLHAGTYELCITVEGEPDYMSCYEIIITEPETFSVTSKIDQTDKIVSFNLSGGSIYKVDFNGLVFNTSDEEITLSLSNGMNRIKIGTELECQGIYYENIFISEDILLFPNPFSNEINIHLGNNNTDKVEVIVYSNLGHIIMSESILVKKGFITIDGSELPSGLYFISIKSNTLFSKFKIVKK